MTNPDPLLKSVDDELSIARSVVPKKAPPEKFKGFPQELVKTLEKQGLKNIKKGTDQITRGVHKYQKQKKKSMDVVARLAHPSSPASFTQMATELDLFLELLKTDSKNEKLKKTVNEYLDRRKDAEDSVANAAATYKKGLKEVKKKVSDVKIAINDIEIANYQVSAAEKKVFISNRKVALAQLKQASSLVSSIGKILSLKAPLELLTAGAGAIIETKSNQISTSIAKMDVAIQEIQVKVASLKAQNAWHRYDKTHESLDQAKIDLGIRQRAVNKAMRDLDAFLRNPEKTVKGANKIGLGGLAKREKGFRKAYAAAIKEINRLEKMLRGKPWKNLEHNISYIQKHQVQMGVLIPKRMKPLDDMLSWLFMLKQTRDNELQTLNKMEANFNTRFSYLEKLMQEVRKKSN